jgi:hypothetical protein
MLVLAIVLVLVLVLVVRVVLVGYCVWVVAEMKLDAHFYDNWNDFCVSSK